jgi:EAL domain-containing protein (putative c-di-GMP-specific phosphodiesterase class I)
MRKRRRAAAAAPPVSPEAWATRLQLALERGELSLVYQPKVHLATGAISGVEALARWLDPELGPVCPSLFVPVAERFGLIDALTDWGLRTALGQWAAWAEQGTRIHLAFNISALSLRDPYLPDYIQRLCMTEGVPCDHLTVEVTESATQNVVRLLDTLTRFRLKGMGVSLDDFGTGYSSLMQLRRLPYSEIKIDQGFVRDAVVSSESRLICKAIVDLAHGIGLVATAEGVEDLETWTLLKALGCDDAQGFLISKPLPGPALPRWLRAFKAPGEEGDEDGAAEAPPLPTIAAMPQSVPA